MYLCKGEQGNGYVVEKEYELHTHIQTHTPQHKEQCP